MDCTRTVPRPAGLARLAGLALAGWLMACVLWAGALAQVPNGAAPGFTVEELQAQIDALPEPGEGDAAESAGLEQQRTFLGTAITRLREAALQEERRAQFSTNMEDARRTLARLEAELESLREDVGARTPMDSDADVVGEDAMFATEQELLARESELGAVQAELDGYRTQLTELGPRITAAPRELNAARAQLGEVTSALAALPADADALTLARRRSLEAREFYQRARIAALEAEIASLPLRQEILGTRRSLAELREQTLAEDVQALQAITGQRRRIEAEAQQEAVARAADVLAAAHPLVAELSRDNVRLAESITEMAAQEPLTSRRLAALRGRTANLDADLDSAAKLVALEELDREAGATLRRLGSQLTPAPQLRADSRGVQRALAQVTRARVVAQEQLRDLPVRAVDPDVLLAEAREDVPALPDLDEASRAALTELVDQRRDLLRQTASVAASRENTLSELAVAQASLVERTEALRSLLDENLLWVPSVPAIDLAWPGKVARGAVELLHPRHFTLAATELLGQARRLWPLVLIGLGLIVLLVRMRPGLWDDVRARADDVGRVRRDSLWHTPAVVGAGLLMATPWPLGFALLAVLFASSDNPDPLVGGLADGFRFVAVFTLVSLTWHVWDRKRSLFGVHFKLAAPLRDAIQRNLRWFIPVMGALVFAIGVVDDIGDADIVEGVGLAAFIAAALTLALFCFRVLWRQRSAYTTLLDEGTGNLQRWRTPLTLVIIGLPLTTAVMAGAGWFSSAQDILWRIFLTGMLLLFTYVIYGIIRRAITVSQRQIKYRQAVERREASIRARREQAEAEARGEDVSPPPPVDTAEIDVSAMSRQSAQLLRVLTLTGLAVMLWFNWADLFPALSIFDGLTLTEINTGDVDDLGNPVTRSITVFTLIQALVIGAITVIAARNLPGFLEIFVLNRLGVDAGARYAVVTILGYLIVGTGIVLAFQRVGLQWSQLRWIVTGLSVGIGFGLQKIIANFVSGLILLFERPIRIGDYVTIGEQSGTVTRIKIRATTLMDLDNREILIPNENLISQEVTNWTLSNSTTRLICTVGIAYGSDTERAREIMLDVLKRNPKVLDTPPPAVLFVNFGDSSLDFELRAFLRAFEDRWPVKHAILMEVNRVLGEAGIEIPFPQRDLNIRTQDMPLAVQTSKTPPARIDPPRAVDYGERVDPDKAAE